MTYGKMMGILVVVALVSFGYKLITDNPVPPHDPYRDRPVNTTSCEGESILIVVKSQVYTWSVDAMVEGRLMAHEEGSFSNRGIAEGVIDVTQGWKPNHFWFIAFMSASKSSTMTTFSCLTNQTAGSKNAEIITIDATSPVFKNGDTYLR